MSDTVRVCSTVTECFPVAVSSKRAVSVTVPEAFIMKQAKYAVAVIPRATRDSVVNGGNELRSYSELHNDSDGIQ